MLYCTDFFNIYIIGTIQIIIEFHFFVKFIDKKANIYHYLLFAGASNFIFDFIPTTVLFKFIAYITLLLLFGIFLYKAKFKTTILYAVITFEIMQLCYGIFNSITGILSPMLYSNHSDVIVFLFIIESNFLALTISYFCYHIIYKYFTHSEIEKNQYVLMILTPLLMIFMLSEYINNTVYGSTIILNENGDMLNANHIQMLALQISSLFSLFCIIYSYKKLVYSFKVSSELSVLEQEKSYQNRYVSEAKLRYEKTQSFRHDIKNHLSIIHGLLEKGNIEQAEKYLESIETLTSDLSFPCRTNNPIIDILIGTKLGIANNNGIAVSCSLEVPYPCLIADMDFCIVISNALDNAINACENITENTEKYINISGRRQGDFFLIDIKNSYNGKQIYKKSTGLYNIKSISEKYNGAVSISTQNREFCLSVLLVIPQQFH